VNINKLKPCRYLGKAPRGLEATIKGGREHKEDLETRRIQKIRRTQSTRRIQKKIHYGSIENQTTPKTKVN
jgi:hypothetical protein